MTKIVVIGRNTPVGRALVDVLRADTPDGDIVAVDADPGREASTWAAGFAGARAVVDVADASGTARDHDIRDAIGTTTRAALAAAEEAGVEHVVFVSSVGLGRASEDEHFTARLGAEVMVEAAPMRSTIVRTTQLFESLRAAAQAGLHGAPAHGRLVIQPIAARDVATEVAAMVLAPPARSVVALAGPERFHLDELVERYRLARFHHREAWVEPAPLATAPGGTSPALLHGGTATLTTTRFRDWAVTAP